MQNRLFSFLLLIIISSVATAQRRDSVVLKTAKGAIYGTLTTPKNVKGAMPVVIIIPGSGPTDRNGNNEIMKNNSLLQLSDSMARHGIASLRYDKRGIGASKRAAPDESALLFTDYVTDVEGWIKMLGKDRRFNKIFIAGHSEGSLIGMLTVKRAPAVAGYISIAGAGRPVDALILDQLGANPQVPKTMIDSTAMYFMELRKEGHIENIPAGFFQSMFRTSVQPYLLSWLQYDPAKEIAGVTIPTLIIQGTTDIQVDTAEAHLLATAKPDAQLLIIRGMNHVFREVSADNRQINMATYYDATMPVKGELVQAMVRFISGTKSKS